MDMKKNKILKQIEAIDITFNLNKKSCVGKCLFKSHKVFHYNQNIYVREMKIVIKIPIK